MSLGSLLGSDTADGVFYRTGSSVPISSLVESTYHTYRMSFLTTFRPTCANTCTESVERPVLASRETRGLSWRIRRCVLFPCALRARLTMFALQAAPFKAIMTSAQHLQKIQRVRVKDTAVEPFMPAYQVRNSLLGVSDSSTDLRSQIALEKLRAHFATGQAKKDEQ